MYKDRQVSRSRRVNFPIIYARVPHYAYRTTVYAAAMRKYLRGSKHCYYCTGRASK